MEHCNSCNKNAAKNCCGNNIYVSGSETRNAIDVTNNKARYYAEIAEAYKNEAKEFRDSAQYYAEQNSDVTMSYIDELEVRLQDSINSKQDSGNYALESDIPEKLSDLEIDADFLSSITATNSSVGIVCPDGDTLEISADRKLVCTDKVLKTSQVTNCLLEVPQRVKFTLENGTLTVLAGSVIIVPYGVEDLTAQYPVGSTFINANFKVYETQYLDGKFYVYAEVQENIVSAATSAGTAGQIRFAHINLTVNNVYGNIKTSSGTSDVSGTQMLHYQDTKNIIQKTDVNGNIYNDTTLSLPFATIASISDGGSSFYTWGYVLQTFEGIGYIGTALWVDKGVKTLTPNGLNADGTLNNIEHIQPNFRIHNHSSMTNGNKVSRYVPSLERTSWDTATNTYYDASTNYNRLTSDNSIATPTAFIGTFNVNNNVITNFHINPPLNINSMCDGQWVGANLTLAASGTTAPTTEPLLYDLSDYLPKDSCSYEVIVNGRATTGSTSGNYVLLTVASSLIPTGIYLCQAATRAAATISARGSAIVPIGADKILTVENATGNVGTFGLYLGGYRRLGGNF